MKILPAPLAVLLVACTQLAQGQNTKLERQHMQRSQIVFVCEHGAALSVVSAAYFNKLAKEHHLNLHAIARGTAPQEDIAKSASAGLKADGVPFETVRPQALSRNEVVGARRIVSFTQMPSRFSKVTPIEMWNDVPPTSANYEIARNAILKHIEKLLGELQSEGSKR